MKVVSPIVTITKIAVEVIKALLDLSCDRSCVCVLVRTCVRVCVVYVYRHVLVSMWLSVTCCELDLCGHAEDNK